MDLSIVIPVLNRRALIRRTIESIRRSPLWPLPVIVVDNGSTDGTLELLEQYSQELPQISVIGEPVRGAAAARNRGLEAVTTPWVYFFDSDDQFQDLPHEWDDNMDLISFPTCQDVDGKVSVRAYNAVSDPAVQILNGMLNTISMIFRTAWLRKIGGWNTGCTIWDDWELGIRALLASPRHQWLTGQPYQCASVHADSITGPNFSSRYRQLLATMAIVADECAAHDDNTGRRCQKALLLRTFILSGRLQYEGDRKASDACRKFIEEHFPGRNSRVSGRALEFYTSCGGRGAWRMALFILNKSKRK